MILFLNKKREDKVFENLDSFLEKPSFKIYSFFIKEKWVDVFVINTLELVCFPNAYE